MKVVVYGAGISGSGAADVLRSLGEEVKIYTDDMGCFENFIFDADLLVLSPGIDTAKQEVQLAYEKGIKVLPEIELAYKICKGQMACITGTNGKTTTTMLVGQMMKTLGVPVKVAGNIGLSLSKEVADLPRESWVVAELSSFQLETTVDFAPQISCVLNLTPDHLERHHSLDAYYEAKKKICSRQNEKQFTVLNYDDENIRYWSTSLRSQIMFFSRQRELPEGVFVKNGQFFIRWCGQELAVCNVDDMQLFGPHNVENILGAIGICYLAGCSIKSISDVVCGFKAVEHRLEYIRTVNGVRYYNDSKATNTDSAIKALQSFPEGHVILIAGGHDKMTDLTDFMDVAKNHVDSLILLGEAKDRFYVAATKAGINKVSVVTDFQEALREAYMVAQYPQVVLLSPACSSYDMFSSFEERGKKFKELVKQL